LSLLVLPFLFFWSHCNTPSSVIFSASSQSKNNDDYYQYINGSSILLLNLSSLTMRCSSCVHLCLWFAQEICFSQEIFVHTIYVPFKLPSVGLSAFHHRKFSHVPFELPTVGLSAFHRNFCACNICTISLTKCGAFRFSQEYFVHATCMQFQLSSVGLSGFHRKFSCTQCMYHGQLIILGLAQARPKYTYDLNICIIISCKASSSSSLLLIFIPTMNHYCISWYNYFWPKKFHALWS